MSQTDVLPAPEIPSAGIPDSKWNREYRAFLGLRQSLLATHRLKYVAIHEGRVVESGDDQIEVALRAYQGHGYQPIYVGLVSDQPQPIVRIPSPRLDPARAK